MVYCFLSKVFLAGIAYGAYEPAKVDKKPQRFFNKWNGTIYHPLSTLNDREKDRYSRKMSNRLDKVLERYQQFKGHCGNYTFAFTDEVDASARFDREDPCRAVGQVQRAVEKWGLIYNRNCKKEGKEKEFSFHNRMTRKLKGLKLTVKDRMDCEE